MMILFLLIRHEMCLRVPALRKGCLVLPKEGSQTRLRGKKSKFCIEFLRAIVLQRLS